MRWYPQQPDARRRQIVRDVMVAASLILIALFARRVQDAVMSLTAISEGFTSNATGVQDGWNGLGESMGRIPVVGDDIQGGMSDLADATFGNAAATGQQVTESVTRAANVLALVTFLAPAAVLLVLWIPRRLDAARDWGAAQTALGGLADHGAVRGSDSAGGSWAPEPPEPSVSSESSSEPSVWAEPSDPSPGGSRDQSADTTASGSHDTVALPLGSSTGQTFPPAHLVALRALCLLPFEDLVRFTPRPFEAYAAGDYGPLVAALYDHEGMVVPVHLSGSAPTHA